MPCLHHWLHARGRLKANKCSLTTPVPLLLPQAGGEPVEVPCPVLRPWTHFDFIPNRLGAMLLHQAGSSKLLYTQLPGRDDPTGSPVFQFGQHAGRRCCSLCACALSHAQHALGCAPANTLASAAHSFSVHGTGA